MKTTVTATYQNGVLKPDEALDLPDDARVTVVIESSEGEQPAQDWKTRQREGFEAYKKFLEEHPIRSGGIHFTRDELHERE
jgi:predicted DNA-binding antitoxin AbrB/MazE fold protein